MIYNTLNIKQQKEEIQVSLEFYLCVCCYQIYNIKSLLLVQINYRECSMKNEHGENHINRKNVKLFFNFNL